jgi:hypothetical protein
MFPLLLEVEPAFQPTWDVFLAEWREKGDLPLYLALSDLARHLITRIEINDTARFDAVFDVVERWHLEGDDYVREAASIGLLEGLQNTYLHSVTKPDAFLPWLRPETRRWWEKVDAFWQKGTIIRDD